MNPVALLFDERRGSIEVYRQEIEIAKQNPFEWLQGQTLFPKLYWAHRSHPIAIATAGSIASFLHFPKIQELEKTPLKLFGWRHFTPTQSPEWLLFPKETYFLPRFELRLQSEKMILAIHSLDTHFPSPHPSKFLMKQPLSWVSKTHSPTQEEWKTSVLASPVEKVVLARKVTFKSKIPIDPLSLMARVNSKNTFHFLIQPAPHLSFFGASPETLFRRSGRLIESEAIAGTHFHTEALFQSKKELSEFSYVQDGIAHSLSPFCIAPPQFTPLSSIQAGELQHLYRTCKATLKEGVSDSTLLHALHPTPAIGGFPRQAALDYLKQVEPFDRGLYSAPIGWASQNHSEWLVAIRSALVEGMHLHLYSGAGIIQGALPDQEWEELDQKLRWLSLTEANSTPFGVNHIQK